MVSTTALSINKKVRQSNEFIAAPYAANFTIHEIKLIEYMISDSKAADISLIENKVHKEFVFTPSQLARLLNTSRSRIVANAEKIAAGIIEKPVKQKVLDENGNIKKWLNVPIISMAKYEHGEFTFSFNYYVLKYFIDINENFTEFQLHYIMGMGSAYTSKLYKLLYQYKNIGKRTFRLYDLKEQFGIEDKYKEYNNFKQRILEPAVEEINEITDLSVKYQEIRVKRKIESIEFSFSVRSSKLSFPEAIDLKSPEGEAFELGELVNALSSTTKNVISEYLKSKGKNYVEASILYAKKNATSNLDKYLKDTLKNGWAEVELKKLEMIEKKKLIEQNALIENEKRKKVEEKILALEQSKKKKIKEEWDSLSNDEQSLYLEYTNTILAAHSDKKSFINPGEKLIYCVYAVTNNKSYDKKIEDFCNKYIFNNCLNAFSV